MRARQTYQPNHLQIPERERPQRIVASYGKDLRTPESIKPLSALMNLRLFLYKTKQKLEYKQASQFTRNDPLIIEQPNFLYNQQQTAHDNQIKFQAYLDGELKPEEYLTLQNYKRLYSITKNDKGSFDDSDDGPQFYLQKESALKKLRERIIHRHNMNKRKRVSEISSQVGNSKCDTPGIQLAKQLKKTIISRHFNKINESLTAEKTLSTLKMVQNAEFAVQQMQSTIHPSPSQKKESPRTIVNSTRSLKIITKRNRTEISTENNESRVQLSLQIVNEASHTFQEKQEEKQKPKKSLKFTNEKMKKICNTTSQLQQFEGKRKCVTERPKYSNLSKQEIRAKLAYLDANSIDERDDSAESSLCSLFEKKINYLYNQSIQLKKSTVNKDSLIKRIKHMQSFNQIVEEAIITNNQKLYQI